MSNQKNESFMDQHSGKVFLAIVAFIILIRLVQWWAAWAYPDEVRERMKNHQGIISLLYEKYEHSEQLERIDQLIQEKYHQITLLKEQKSNSVLSNQEIELVATVLAIENYKTSYFLTIINYIYGFLSGVAASLLANYMWHKARMANKEN